MSRILVAKNSSRDAHMLGADARLAANDDLTAGDVASIASELSEPRGVQFPDIGVRMSREHPGMTEHAADQMMLAEQRRVAAMGWPTW